MDMENLDDDLTIAYMLGLHDGKKQAGENIHCESSPRSVGDEPIEYKLFRTPCLEPNVSAEEAVKAQRPFKKSRSKYSPVEEDRKHSQND